VFLRQLEYLVALAQEQHFTRAAQHCNVSQPSLSNAIKQLERELGTPVVLRHQRFQGFTAEGARIIEWSKRILADRHPGVQVEVSFLGLEEMRVKLTNFELDVGITYIDQKQPVPLVSLPLYKEHLSLLVPDRPGAAAPSQMTWSAAAALPLCLLSANMHERTIIDSAFASVGKSPVPLIESDSIVNLAFHTMASGMVTVVPSHFDLVIGAFPGTRVIRLVEPEVIREVGLIWVGGDPILPMAKAMLGLLKSLSGHGEIASWLTAREPVGAAASARR
jgi:DNA-binding transcriptional LysR family regulator